MRIGQGFDMHPLQLGEGLMLGGVFFACNLSVRADSDGDVLLHALGDALLGAAGLGDIGLLYPPGDSSGQGLAGSALIGHIVGLLAERNLCVVHADLTLICEQPRLGEQRRIIGEKIAQMLSLLPDRVGVKATTTDGLGVTGRGEGIAALATVLVDEVAGGGA